MIILHFDLQPQFKYMNYFIYTSHQLDIVSYYSRSNCAGNFNQPRTLGLSDSASRLSFAWKSFVKKVKKNTTEVSSGLGACKHDMWSHVLQVAWASEDEQKGRLQWFHTTFWMPQLKHVLQTENCLFLCHNSSCTCAVYMTCTWHLLYSRSQNWFCANLKVKKKEAWNSNL